MSEVDPVDALDHIYRVAKGSRSQTRRLRWIAGRAADALGLGGDWRDLNYPVHVDRDTDRLREKIKDLEDKYSELIMEVSIKHPDETRHETARRYIRQAEVSSDQCGAKTVVVGE
jgi:hypothetical protein